jgi:uncharacterized protein (TIGR02186 family)
MRRFLAALLTCALSAPAMSSDRMTTLLSTNRVEIHSTYTGAEIVVFGAIEGEIGTTEPVSVRVIGPRGGITIREKSQLGPIYINQHRARLADIPQFHLLETSLPLERMKEAKGFDEAALSPLAGQKTTERQSRFVDALMRLKEEQGLYRVDATAVRFATPRLFQARIPLPANAPLGRYFVETALYGSFPAESRNEFYLVKSGFEAQVAWEARNRPWLYGLAAVLMSLVLGWLASVAFRRD